MSADNKNEQSAARPARRGPRPFAQDAGALLNHHLSARGFAQIELVTRWSEIAGRALAEHCFPYRLSAPSASGTTLTLVADDRAALELQHQAPKLIDKINGYFGRAVVERIKVVTGNIPQTHPSRPPARALTAGEEAELLKQVGDVEDANLREALTRLGRAALAERRKPEGCKR